MNKGDARETFPSTLHRMLTEINHVPSRDSSMAHLQAIVNWQDHGMAFKIHDRQKFIDLIMPQWFCRLKYTSLIRQLNLYGFKRIHKEGADKGAMYHEDFMRDMPELAAGIPKLKRNKRKSETGNEPNFQVLAPFHLQMSMTRPMSMPVTAHEFQQASPRGQQCQQVPVRADAYADESKSGPPSPRTAASLRDMLMPVLPPHRAGSATLAMARMHGEFPATAQYFRQAVPSTMARNAEEIFDPFSNLWQTVDDSATPHNDESLNWEDMEPLRVFGPGGESSEDHRQGSNSTPPNNRR